MSYEIEPCSSHYDCQTCAAHLDACIEASTAVLRLRLEELEAQQKEGENAEK